MPPGTVKRRDRTAATGVMAVLGVGAHSERVYRHLLRAGPLEVQEMAGALGLPAASMRGAVRELTERGLVAPAPGGADRWVAVAPQTAMARLIEQHENQLVRARAEMLSLVVEQRAVHHWAEMTGPVELVEGADGVSRAYDEAVGTATRELLVLSKSPFVGGREQTTEVLGVLGRNVATRAIYDRWALDRPQSLSDITTYQAAGEQVRVADELPLKLLIADRRTALLPAEEGQAQRWLVIRGGALVTSLLALFELLWRRSVPLAVAVGDGRAGGDGDGTLSGADAQLLGMLCAGLTDAAIARQLRTSVRTVQRRLTRLMDWAGVASRAQLAWQAARAGWLSE